MLPFKPRACGIFVVAYPNPEKNATGQQTLKDWVLLVKPKKSSRFGRLPPTELRFFIDSEGKPSNQPPEPSTYFLIGQSVRKDVFEVLAHTLGDVSQQHERDSNNMIGGMRAALRSLEEKTIVESFDVETFLTFMRERLKGSEAGTEYEVNYLDLCKSAKHNNPSKEEGHWGFWLSKPQAQHSHATRRAEDPYGGLI